MLAFFSIRPLAKAALKSGDKPFGSVLVSSRGVILEEEHNHVATGDHARHPDFALARRAAENTLLHCLMCAAAHGWVGLGRIVFASSSAQLTQWLSKVDIARPLVRNLPIQDVIRDPVVDGPVAELADEVRELHRQFYTMKEKHSDGSLQQSTLTKIL
ncbi:tRNA(Arg) A34 adenosine deaminase TadA [Fictibacillus solisalsi]|uniref:tRNA(Arg) A34 adenosine deaminase TadA n=1 Tax=Fictibacillus solisalsi TaxID=459525 RepID=A0A1G9WK14_9BACL|nr:tRNA-specific adenosine deaminase [Fictibacillus solisalsi]SDM84830.1 tRNA(Arg) A34 adenosine deaminase TadA [Fictibacillus solisalsi]